MKTFIQFTSFGLLFGTAFASSLQGRWNIDGPEFTYDKKTISLDFKVNDAIKEQQILYTLYNGLGCKEESNLISIDDNSFVQSKSSLSADGADIQDARLDLAIDPSTIASASVYKEIDATHAEVQFCIRMGLYTGEPSSSDSIEVNFLETPVILKIILKSGFEIGGVESSA